MNARTGHRLYFARRTAAANFILALLLVLIVRATAFAQTLTDSNLVSINFDQKLNSQLSLDLPFVDEDGKAVRLGDYFGQKPVILLLGYYECPMLCSMVLNGLVEDLQDMKWSIGKEFQIVYVSINPNETPRLAAAKKRTYLKRYSRASAAQGWHFLTGAQSSSKLLADQVGFQYAYDEVSRQYAHPSGVVILTPEGKVARYFFGVKFAPDDLYASLQAASSRKIGSRIQELVLLCFHYRPITGKYGALIMGVVRAFGVLTVLALAWSIFGMVRRDKKLEHTAPARAMATPPAGSRTEQGTVLCAAAFPEDQSRRGTGGSS